MAQPLQVFCSYYDQCAESQTSPQSGDRYTVLQDEPKGAFFNSDMHIFNGRWDVAPGYRLEYLFGYFKTDEAVTQDWDGTPLELYHTDRPAQYAQHSHELRLTQVSDSPLSYTVGLYSWTSNYRIDLVSYIGFYDSQVTVIPEGDHYEFFGWALPGFGKFSFSKSYLSWLRPGEKYRLGRFQGKCITGFLCK